ncbi:hypothetical protein EII42_03560 [Tessaracoccus sp. OH4464_COT-324]|nr:hypothetical protein [Tessaracoccus sp. OH4464_COT-324]RRD47073.1 hypothetical protein EII42_03560 [Tessaracoccus sp. OH4464_COT-324]
MNVKRPREVLVRARSGLIAAQIGVGVGEEALRLWCDRYVPEVAPTPVAESLEEQNKRLKRELAEARRANEILKAASAFFARELDRPTTR